jgi:hypothetical protein
VKFVPERLAVPILFAIMDLMLRFHTPYLRLIVLMCQCVRQCLSWS